MSITGVSIVKANSFRGVAQEFGNTYYYKTPLSVPAATADGLIDTIVALERPLFATSVSFIRAKAWSAGGTKAENEMLAQKPLTGTGSNATAPSGNSMDRERAFLVRFRAGNDSKGRPVYLRKWWHLDAIAWAGSSPTAAQLQNTAALTSAQRTAIQSAADNFKTLNSGGWVWELCSENGRVITGATVAHAYLEHRQLGDMWR